MTAEAEIDTEDRGECVVQDKFNQAAKQLKDRKAFGVDYLLAELIKNAGDTALNELFNLLSKIYETGQLPSDFQKSIIIRLPNGSYVTPQPIDPFLKILSRLL